MEQVKNQKIMDRLITLLVILPLLLPAGCAGDGQPDGRLAGIAETVSRSPREALAGLDSIDPAALSEADRHYYDFLTVKARDKAYVAHTSDSLILDVIDYYADHDRDHLHAEALYYGGRVYSDLGDSPTALRYFQAALDAIPDTGECRRLRCKTSSQTGRLLNSLRLYDEAVPYVEEAIRLDSALNDTLNYVYDLQLLGHIFKGDENYDRAEFYFWEALERNCDLPLRHKADSEMYLADVERRRGNIGSALNLIRKTRDSVSPMSRNEWLSFAVYLYWDAGILDTAYLYAHELISNSDRLNKKIGYHAVLSPELRRFVDPDSLDVYLTDYRGVLEHDFNENEAKLFVDQQARYNYELHEREKIKTERRNYVLKEWIFVFIIAVVLMAMVILYLKNRNKANIINLQHALENIGRLRQQLNSVQATPTIPLMEPTGENLRERLKNELLSLYHESDEHPEVPVLITQSCVYEKLQKMITESRPIKENDGIWTELENAVLECSPKFVSNLNLLTAGRLTNLDLHTALLIKCGFKPSQLTILLGKSNGAIISRRETLCVKVLGKKMGVKVIDGVIRLL